MRYEVLIKRSAEKELDSLPSSVSKRIAKRLFSLEGDPRPAGAKKLQGEEAYRLRVANYRVLYTVDDATRQVAIYAVGHRREIYR